MAGVGIVAVAGEDLDAAAVVVDQDDAVAFQRLERETDADAGQACLVDLGHGWSLLTRRGEVITSRPGGHSCPPA